MGNYTELRQYPNADAIWQNPDGTEAFRIPGSLKRMLVDALEPLAIADETGRLEGDAYLYMSQAELGNALRTNDAIWDAMNQISNDPADHDRIIAYAYGLVPDWAKSRELLEKKFKVRVNDMRLDVSHGFLRGDLRLIDKLEAQQCDQSSETKFSA